MTPFPVPIHKRLHETIRAVILTNEKPSLPVPAGQQDAFSVLLWNPTPVFTADCDLVLTEHLADVGLDVDVLEVLVCVCVEQSESGVQLDGHPDPVPMPGQLTDLAVLTRVGVEGFLREREKWKREPTCWSYGPFGIGSLSWLKVSLHLNLHGSGMHHMDLVPVAAPHTVMHHGHAADGVVLLPQVQQVVVGQVPLPIWRRKVKTLPQKRTSSAFPTQTCASLCRCSANVEKTTTILQWQRFY